MVTVSGVLSYAPQKAGEAAGRGRPGEKQTMFLFMYILIRKQATYAD